MSFSRAAIACRRVHQKRIQGMAARPWTYPERFALTFFQSEGRLRTRKPFIHAVVPVSSVSSVQMSTPRGQSPADVVPVSCQPDRLVLVSVTRQRRSEGRGGIKSLELVNRKPITSLFFCVRRFRGGGVPPPSRVLPGRSQLRVVSSARTR